MDDKHTDLFCIWILYVLAQSEKKKWDEYRNKAVDLTDPLVIELENYFEDMFKGKIPQYKLPLNTSLYRARQIKSNKWGDIETDINSLKDEFFKILLTEDEFKTFEGSGIPASPNEIAMLKMLVQKEMDENQLNKYNEFIMKYSDPNCFYGFSKSDCGVPPENKRQTGRLNTENDPYLYLALNKDTAIYERRPSISQSYSLATCETNRELILVDLRLPREIKFQDDFIVSYLAEKVSEPNTDNDNKFYHITQCLSHFLQKKGYDGIIYASAIKKNGVNVMLFDENNVTFTSSEIITIDNITINYTTNLPFSE